MSLISQNRRKRLSRPKTLVFFGIVFLVLPFVNYYSISQQFGIQPVYFQRILKSLSYLEIFFLIFPIVVGAGLLLVKKWGWWVFMGYSTLLIGYNAFLLATTHNAWNLGSLVRAILGTAIVIYFARKDISAPYFKMYPRGWRLQKRIPFVMDVKVDGKIRKTKDVSPTGIYIDWENCNLELNRDVALEMNIDNTPISIKAGVVRIDPDGAGLAFRGLSRENKLIIEKIL